MKPHSRVVLAACAATSLMGCASVESHLHDTRHPWHAYPAIGTELVILVPFLPLAYAENALTGRELGTCGGNASFVVGAGTGLLVGTAVGGAFWVAGSPLELVLPLDHEASERPKLESPENRTPSPPPAPEAREP